MGSPTFCRPCVSNAQRIGRRLDRILVQLADLRRVSISSSYTARYHSLMFTYKVRRVIGPLARLTVIHLGDSASNSNAPARVADLDSRIRSCGQWTRGRRARADGRRVWRCARAMSFVCIAAEKPCALCGVGGANAVAKGCSRGEGRDAGAQTGRNSCTKNGSDVGVQTGEG